MVAARPLVVLLAGHVVPVEAVELEQELLEAGFSLAVVPPGVLRVWPASRLTVDLRARLEQLHRHLARLLLCTPHDDAGNSLVATLSWPHHHVSKEPVCR